MWVFCPLVIMAFCIGISHLTYPGHFPSLLQSYPSQTKLHVLYNCLCHRDSLGMRANETGSWRRTKNPNCFKNPKSHSSCKGSQHGSSEMWLLPGEKTHLEQASRLPQAGSPPEFPSVAKGSLCLGSCLERNAAGFTGGGGGGGGAVLLRTRGH